MGPALTRRDVLRAGLAGGAGLALPGLVDSGALIQRALAAAPVCGRLADIEHVVFLVQENRSFDSYFGTLRAVRGFADPNAGPGPGRGGRRVFAQPGYPAAGFGGHLYPFHIDSARNGECTHDITHDWGPQHRSWNAGAMDGFVTEHTRAEGANGALTMGYYRRADLPFYYALADAFTVCDAYHCSVLGPTDPNQLYLVSATLDPAGRAGGPLVETLSTNRTQSYGSLSWTTMPEQLEGRGISWKVYSGDNASPEEDSPFPLFRQYHERRELAANALAPTFPGSFQADVKAGQLPQVSWVYATILQSEHPPAPVTYGEHTASLVLDALVSNPALWAKTALFITWDENGGFFDHVAPAVAPRGTPGEHLSVKSLPAAAQGLRGPIGLGFRVPLLVVSPFSRGGLVCSERFDHTSLLRFLETRFGAEVPNLSSWRRSVTGDLTSALNFAAPDASVPTLPAPSLTDPRVLASSCTVAPGTLLPGVGTRLAPYPVPPNSMPGQEPGRARRPSGPVCPPGTGEEHHRGGSRSGGSGLSVTVRPHRGICRRGRLEVVIEVHHTAPLRWVHVYLAGQRIASTRRSRVRLRLPPEGKVEHLSVIVRDAAGRHLRRRLRLARCPSRRRTARHVSDRDDERRRG